MAEISGVFIWARACYANHRTPTLCALDPVHNGVTDPVHPPSCIFRADDPRGNMLPGVPHGRSSHGHERDA